jgi:hypothetical protein
LTSPPKAFNTTKPTTSPPKHHDSSIVMTTDSAVVLIPNGVFHAGIEGSGDPNKAV